MFSINAARIWPRHRSAGAFTLAEVVISVGIATLVFAGLITGYVQSSYRAEWSGYSIAAQALAVHQRTHGNRLAA